MNIMLPSRHVNIGIIGLTAQDYIPKSGFQPKLHPHTGTYLNGQPEFRLHAQPQQFPYYQVRFRIY
jgi:hypothetical protein